MVTVFFFALTLFCLAHPEFPQAAEKNATAQRDELFRAYFRGEYGKAGELAEQHLKGYPQDAEAWNLAGNIELSRGDFVKAEIFYRNAVALQPDSILWTMSLADLMLVSGKFLRAREILEKLVRENPDLLLAQTYLCGIHFRYGDIEKCAPYLLSLKPEGVEDVELCLLSAAYHAKKKNFHETDRWIRRALELSPYQQDIMGMKYLNDTHLGRIVLDEVRKNESGAKSSLMEHYQKAGQLLDSGNLLQAQDKIKWLMRYYPEDLELRMMLAVAEGELGYLESAKKTLTEIMKTKTDKVSLFQPAQEMLKEFVREEQFEKQVKEKPWTEADIAKTEYYDVRTNLRAPYKNEILEELDEQTGKILDMLRPVFGDGMKLNARAKLNVYADKKSFIHEIYDHMFSDAVFFAGVYVRENGEDFIYYHFDKDLRTTGVVHEIAHFVLNNLVVNAPNWLNEGFADYAGTKLSGIDALEAKLAGKTYMGQLDRFGNLPPFDVVVKLREYDLRSYILWRNAVQFVLEFGDGKYRAPLKKYIELISNESFQVDPFREAFADHLDDIDKDWREFSRAKVIL